MMESYFQGAFDFFLADIFFFDLEDLFSFTVSSDELYDLLDPVEKNGASESFRKLPQMMQNLNNPLSIDFLSLHGLWCHPF